MSDGRQRKRAPSPRPAQRDPGAARRARRWLGRLTVTLALWAGAGGCGENASGPPGPTQLPPWNGDFEFADTVLFDGRQRSFLAHLPPGYDHERALPLLVVFHGGGERAGRAKEWSDLDAFADEYGFVVAFPDAVSGWGEGCDCTGGDVVGVDDVAFTRFLIRYMSRTWAVDRDRAFAAGFSAGGAFTQRLACALDSPVRGIASVGMTMRDYLPGLCNPPGSDPSPLPVLVMLGADDPVVPPEGREDLLSLEETAGVFRDLNRCTGAPTVSFEPEDPGLLPRVRTEEYRACAGGSRLRIDRIDGMGHEWPREGANETGIDASRIVAEFLFGR